MNLINSTHESLDVAAISAALGKLSKRFNVDVLTECDSTNTQLMALAGIGAPSGTVLAAERQSAGRGRRGHAWLSAPGASLTFSLLWRFPSNTLLSGLSLAVGVALARAMEALDIPEISLKWPNDVLLNGSKLAGVLIELVPGTHLAAAVLGVGINLRLPEEMPDEIRKTAAALADVGINLPTPSTLLAKLLIALHEALQSFAEQGFAGLRSEWLNRNAYAGQEVRLLSDFAPPLVGYCRGVDSDGALLLETEAGMLRIISGEVSLRKA
ncbi:MAG: biotin--[acetyl-CoA-carboxylase] ligase [Sterolibacterium sp.]|nr:biotin--[acetyl-CoA-carboxylase] ligase [Sterolibacterium sp.]